MCTIYVTFFIVLFHVFQAGDPAVEAIRDKTDEGIRVAAAGGQKYIAVYRRLENPDRYL